MRVFLLCPADKAPNHRYGLLGPSSIPNLPAKRHYQRENRRFGAVCQQIRREKPVKTHRFRWKGALFP
jgi:hypothetical protein